MIIFSNSSWGLWEHPRLARLWTAKRTASIFTRFCPVLASSPVQIYYSSWFIIFCPTAVSFSSGTSGSAEPRTRKCWLMAVHSCRWPWGNTRRRRGCPSSIVLELNVNNHVLLFCASWRSCSRLAYYCYIFYRSRSLSFLPPFLSSFFLLLMLKLSYCLYYNFIKIPKHEYFTDIGSYECSITAFLEIRDFYHS